MAFRSDRMRNLREKRGMTQKELALAVSAKQQHISRYEQGTRHPASDVLYKIAEALDTTTDYLLGLTSDSKRLSEDERRLIAWLRSLTHKPTAEDLLRFFDRQNMPKHRQPRPLR